MKRFFFALVTGFLLTASARADNDFLSGIHKVVFLGDSITYDGRYIAIFETEIRFRYPQKKLEILNLGLPSETVSGLSEDGHAGGKFPRPGLHERLSRVLDQTNPKLIFASYGMNDGIYLPLAEERFEKYKAGMEKLRAEAAKRGISVIHLTPAVFDPNPIRKRLAPADKVDSNHPYEGYGKVLDTYSDWLLAKKGSGWNVLDLHGPMNKALAKERDKKADFTFAPDGVHPNLEGQLILAEALIKQTKLAEAPPMAEYLNPKSERGQVFQLLHQRQRVLTDAWLTETKHLRPMPKGLPLDQAQKKANELEAKAKLILDNVR